MKKTAFSSFDIMLMVIFSFTVNIALVFYNILPLIPELLMLLLGVLRLRLHRHLTDEKHFSIPLHLFFALRSAMGLAIEFLLMNSFLDYLTLIDRIDGNVNWLQYFCNDLYYRAVDRWEAYLWLIVAATAAFLLQALWRSPSTKTVLHRFKWKFLEFSWVKIIREAFQPEDLEFFVQHFLENGAFDALFDYCEAMPCTEKSKNELLDCIDRYDLRILYDTLFEKCRDLLADEEYAYYQELYDKKFYPDEEECQYE